VSGEPDHFLLQMTTTVNFRGGEHTISSRYQPVFTGDEYGVFVMAFDNHKRAHMLLAGHDQEEQA
jgi:hypothetical protein